MIGIIFPQQAGNGNPLLFQPHCRIFVHIAAGGIRGPVGSVRSHGKNSRIPQSPNPCRSRQSQLLVSSSQALSRQPHHRLPAGNVGHRFSFFLMIPGYGRQKSACLFRLAVQAGGKQAGLISEFPAGPLQGGAQFPHAARNPGRHILTPLGGLRLQKPSHILRNLKSVFFHNLPAHGAGCGIPPGRPGGNHIQPVSQHIGEDYREHPGGKTHPGKPPSLHTGEPLADHVDFPDGSAAGQKLFCHIPEIFL